MTHLKIVFLAFLLFASNLGFAQQVEVVNFLQLEENWLQADDTLYLVNYWATWCKPCVEELPDFLQLEQEMEGTKFKMILVSLDFPNKIESRVVPFLQKNKITSHVVLLDDDANVWINQVNKNWDGAIPATQLIKNKHFEFYGEQLSYEKLNHLVQQINKNY